MKKYSILTLALLCLTYICNGQDKAEMADVLRSNGKIYIVVAVLVTVFIGIALFLIYLERKVKNLEKNS